VELTGGGNREQMDQGAIQGENQQYLETGFGKERKRGCIPSF
jgi:hypothetical protein